MIEFKHVSKEFVTNNGKVSAVSDLNLSVEDGNILGIVGYSGAGKSTLIRMLNGLETPTSGEVDVNGAKIASLTGKALRKQRQKIGMIFQHFNLLWSRTVVENIMFPLEIAGLGKEERLAKAEELTTLVGLKGKENAYPSELSGGQKQRVGIARALANDPEILICDEATSALDPQTTDEILDLLLQINHKLNLTIVLITHEMHVVRKICDHVAVMENGKLVEDGLVLDVFKRPQQDVTKRFVNQEVTPAMHDTEIAVHELIEAYPQGLIVQLTFHSTQTQMPIISEMLRQIPEIDFNIVEGSIHQTQGGPIGTLYIQLTGPKESLDQAIPFLQKMKVETEVLHYGD